MRNEEQIEVGDWVRHRIYPERNPETWPRQVSEIVETELGLCAHFGTSNYAISLGNLTRTADPTTTETPQDQPMPEHTEPRIVDISCAIVDVIGYRIEVLADITFDTVYLRQGGDLSAEIQIHGIEAIRLVAQTILSTADTLEAIAKQEPKDADQ